MLTTEQGPGLAVPGDTYNPITNVTPESDIHSAAIDGSVDSIDQKSICHVGEFTVADIINGGRAAAPAVVAPPDLSVLRERIAQNHQKQNQAWLRSHAPALQLIALQDGVRYEPGRDSVAAKPYFALTSEELAVANDSREAEVETELHQRGINLYQQMHEVLGEHPYTSVAVKDADEPEKYLRFWLEPHDDQSHGISVVVDVVKKSEAADHEGYQIVKAATEDLVIDETGTLYNSADPNAVSIANDVEQMKLLATVEQVVQKIEETQNTEEIRMVTQQSRWNKLAKRVGSSLKLKEVVAFSSRSSSHQASPHVGQLLLSV